MFGWLGSYLIHDLIVPIRRSDFSNLIVPIGPLLPLRAARAVSPASRSVTPLTRTVHPQLLQHAGCRRPATPDLSYLDGVSTCHAHLEDGAAWGPC